MINIAIIEDDLKDKENLEKQLLNFQKEENEDLNIDHYRNGESFIMSFKSNYDLIFIDIELGGMDGMEIAKAIRKVDERVMIIFCTSIASMAIKGYEFNAIDYMIKPVSYEDIALRMKKIVDLCKNSQTKVSIPVEDGIKVLSVREIIYIESYGHDTIYHTKEVNYSAKERKSMKSLENEFAKYGFSRCNISYIVNLAHLKAINGSDAILANGEVLPISRNRKKEFVEDLTHNLNINGGI